MKTFKAIGVLALVLLSLPAAAAEYPAPKQGDWIARDFKFHTGEVMSELKLHYTTIGDPAGIPAVVLHGSGQSAGNMLTRPSRTNYRSRPAPRCHEILHRHSGRARSGKSAKPLKAWASVMLADNEDEDAINEVATARTVRPWFRWCVRSARPVEPNASSRAPQPPPCACASEPVPVVELIQRNFESLFGASSNLLACERATGQP